MTVTIGTNLTTINTNDNSSDWTGTDGPDSYYNHIQGTNSESWLVSKNSTEIAIYDDSSTYNMSASKTHFFIWLKTDLANYYTSVKLILESTTGNYKTWELANVTSLIWDGAWKCFVVDLAAGVETGTFNSASVSKIKIELNNSSSGNIRSVINTWIDAMRFGTGIDVNESSATPFDFDDIETLLNNETNKLGVIARNPDTGILELQCPITISGNGSDTNFTSENEILAWVDNDVMNDFYGISFVDSDLDVDIDDLIIMSYGTNNDNRPSFDSSGTVGTFDMKSSSLIRGDLITFKTGQTIENCKFTNCYQVIPPSATGSFKNNTIANSVATDGALLWPVNDAIISYLIFINCDNGIEYDSSSDSSDPTFRDIIFDDEAGNYDVNNTSGSAVTILKTGTSNPNSYTGSTVTFSSSITLKMIVKDENNAVVVGAYAYVDNDNQSPYIMNTITNGSGEASTAYSGSSVNGSTWRVRKYGYKAFKQLVDISSLDITLPVTLISDPQQT